MLICEICVLKTRAKRVKSIQSVAKTRAKREKNLNSYKKTNKNRQLMRHRRQTHRCQYVDNQKSATTTMTTVVIAVVNAYYTHVRISR